MDIFQRSIHSNVKELDDGFFLVTSQMLDLEHSMHLELLVSVSDGRIERANAVMSKVPFAKCHMGAEGIKKLAGMKIERGIMGNINNAVGGPRGCSHMVELVCDAVRLIAMLRIRARTRYGEIERKNKTDEDVIAELGVFLRNSCLVFADEAKTKD